MKVELRVFATYREPIAKILGEDPTEAIYLERPQGTTIGELIDSIGLGEEKAIIILVNGLHQEKNYLLSDDDRVALFPPVGGG